MGALLKLAPRIGVLFEAWRCKCYGARHMEEEKNTDPIVYSFCLLKHRHQDEAKRATIQSQRDTTELDEEDYAEKDEAPARDRNRESFFEDGSVLDLFEEEEEATNPAQSATPRKCSAPTRTPQMYYMRRGGSSL